MPVNILDPDRVNGTIEVSLNDDGSLASAATLSAVSTDIAPPAIKHRTARAVATWAANALFTVVTLAVAFITTPLLLKYLGQERLGAFRAAGEWFGYLSLIDLGITPALGVLILRARTKNSEAETASIFRSGLILLVVVALVTAAAGFALASFMPRLILVSPSLNREMVTSAHLLVLPVLLLPFQMSRMFLESEQRGYWGYIANLIQSITAAILSVILARRGFGLVAQAAALLIGTLLGTLIFVVPSWRWYLARPPSDVKVVTPRSIWRLGWPLALSGLGIRLNGMTDSVVVGYMLGPIAIFKLFVTQRMVAMFGGQINSIANASWAALADLRMVGRQDAFVAGIIELTELVVGLGVALTGTVAAFNHQFVRLWVGDDHYGGDFLSYLTAMVSVLTGLAAIYGFSLDSAGETAARIPVSIGGAIGNLLLSVLLVKYLGLSGVILGTVIAAMFSDAWFCPFQVHRLFGVPGGQIVRAVLRGGIRAIPLAGAAAVVAHVYHPSNWLDFTSETFVVGTLSLFYVWLFIFGPNDRQRWALRLRSRFLNS